MNQGSVSSYLNGVNALNARVAGIVAGLIKVPVESFSPRLAKEIAEMAAPIVGGAKQESAGQAASSEQAGTYGAAAKVMEMLSKHGKSLRPDQQARLERAVADTLNDQADAAPADNVIVADFSRRPLVGDEIRIAHYDVQGAMGNGKLVHDFPEMFRDVTVSQQHLRDLGVTYKDPTHLKLITGVGQSMAPTIQDKDPLIVDASVREFTGDGIYAFIWQGHFYIKSLQIVDAEHFKMVSKAEKLYPPVEIRIDETYIQARVLLVWNAQKL
ncbi:S24 family peptidase [Ectopseudomonas mendocina]|nr:S24 family peptidase [Pseudomonas mendocina]TRO24994.1 S24 family peptidase [Pseudomonas mendocina]